MTTIFHSRADLVDVFPADTVLSGGPVPFNRRLQYLLADKLPTERTVVNFPHATLKVTDRTTGKKKPLYIWLNVPEDERSNVDLTTTAQLLGEFLSTVIQKDFTHVGENIESSGAGGCSYYDHLRLLGYATKSLPALNMTTCNGKVSTYFEYASNLGIAINPENAYMRQASDERSLGEQPLYGTLTLAGQACSMLFSTDSMATVHAYFTDEALERLVVQGFNDLFCNALSVEQCPGLVRDITFTPK